MSDVDITGLRLVHPEAAHLLLERLGCRGIEASDLFDSPELRAAVERSLDDRMSGLDTRGLAEVVLRLVDSSLFPQQPDWLSSLALPGLNGWRRADELVLPASPLREIFDPEIWGSDAALDVLDADFALQWPAETLIAVGVLDTFAVIVDEQPLEPDHGLPEEDQWWDSLGESPTVLLGVKDLDLVSERAWPAALRLLAARPETWTAFKAEHGYTSWWISRYADLHGQPPRDWRFPDATAVAGLFDSMPESDLSKEILLAAGVRRDLKIEDSADLADLIDRLADRRRQVSPGLVTRAYAQLVKFADVAAAGSAVSGSTGLDSIDVDFVRVADGSVVEADQAMVLDQPWLVAAHPVDRLIVVGSGEQAKQANRLADLLDISTASEVTSARVSSRGYFVPWAELAAVGETLDLMGLPVPDGGVVLHDQLFIAVGTGPAETSQDGAVRKASWWCVEPEGEIHAEDSPEGLARALAWATGQWSERYRIAALLEDPLNSFI